MELNVSFVRQPAGTVWCGAASAAMVLKFSGKKISLKRVVQELSIKSSYGITNAHLASYFLDYDMDVVVQAWPTGMPDSFCSNGILRNETAVETLKQGKHCTKGKARVMCRELVALAKRGGGIIFHPITLDDLRNRLETGSVVIVSLDAKHFMDIPHKAGHYVLVYGITDRDSQVTQSYVYMHDPLRGPDRFVAVKDILAACSSWFGSAIYVTPKQDGDRGMK